MSRICRPAADRSPAAALALTVLWVGLTSLTAVGILGAFASRVDLGPLLSGIVADYERLSRALWHDQLPRHLGVWIDLPDAYLSFIALVAAPLVVNAVLNLTIAKDYKFNSLSWPITSSLCIVFFSFSFAMLSNIWIGTLGMSLYGFATLLLIALVGLLAAAALGVAVPVPRWRRLHVSAESEINIVIVVLLLFMAGVLVGTLEFAGQGSAMDMKRMALFGVTLLGIYATFKLRLKAPVYAMVSLLGLVSAAWTVDFGLPALVQLAKAGLLS